MFNSYKPVLFICHIISQFCLSADRIGTFQLNIIVMKVEPGSSIEDSQGGQSNMDVFYATNPEPRSLLEHLSGDNVPKTTQYLHDSVSYQIL